MVVGGVESGDRQGVALGVGVVAGGGDDDGRVLGGRRGVGDRRRCVVDAGDGQRRRRRIGAAVAVVDGVGERIRRRFARLQRVEPAVGIVGEGAIGGDGEQRAGRQRDLAADVGRDPVDPGHRQGVAFGVVVAAGAVVGEDVAGETRVLVGGEGIVGGDGRVVDAGDRHLDPGGGGAAVVGGDGVEEAVGGRLAVTQMVEPAARIVGDGAVGVARHLAHRQIGVDVGDCDGSADPGRRIVGEQVGGLEGHRRVLAHRHRVIARRRRLHPGLEGVARLSVEQLIVVAQFPIDADIVDQQA